MTILILNGPNLNLLGTREPEIYGTENFESAVASMQRAYPDLNLVYIQSNHEGELIDALQQYGFLAAGIVFNPGGYTHTSVAIRDAVAAIKCPVIEVHISNTAARESFRHHSMIAPVCAGSIIGLGLDGYRLGVEWLLRNATI